MKSNKYQSLIMLKQGKPIMININGKYIPINEFFNIISRFYTSKIKYFINNCSDGR